MRIILQTLCELPFGLAGWLVQLTLDGKKQHSFFNILSQSWTFQILTLLTSPISVVCAFRAFWLYLKFQTMKFLKIN
jgi:hypothetical protein